jgi:hypothetical protein
VVGDGPTDPKRLRGTWSVATAVGADAGVDVATYADVGVAVCVPRRTTMGRSSVACRGNVHVQPTRCSAQHSSQLSNTTQEPVVVQIVLRGSVCESFHRL